MTAGPGRDSLRGSRRPHERYNLSMVRADRRGQGVNGSRHGRDARFQSMLLLGHVGTGVSENLERPSHLHHFEAPPLHLRAPAISGGGLGPPASFPLLAKQQFRDHRGDCVIVTSVAQAAPNRRSVSLDPASRRSS